ncbi:MAG: HNH endonuclease signature motif containing protein [Gemmatimonas sp.]
MRYRVISDTIQEFDGIAYYRCGKYFQRNGKRLHRVACEAVHGPIPRGAHVHHADGNASNNDPANLVIVDAREHIKEHMREPRRMADSQRAIVAAQLAAADWHRSEEGRAWHRAQYEQVKDALHRKRPAVCKQCGGSYETNRKDSAAFCSGRCKAAFRRTQKLDHETRACAHCGAAFECNRFLGTQHCGKRCSALAREAAFRASS